MSQSRLELSDYSKKRCGISDTPIMPDPIATTMDTSTQPSESDSSSAKERLAEALNTGRLDDAEVIVVQEDMGRSGDTGAVLLVGLLRMKQRRWGDAERIFSGITGELSEASERQRLLARNLAAVERHHPELLPSLLDEAPCTECRVEETPAGELSIAQRAVGGRWVCLTKGESAKASCRDHLSSLSERAEDGASIALCGVGDGYLLSHFASHPPELFLDRELTIYILEPHPEVLLHVMMIHDLSEEDGPFAQKRFQWCLGADWALQIESLLRKRVYLPYPEHFLALSMVGVMMEKRIHQLAADFVTWEEGMVREIHERYAGRTREAWVELLSDSPPRPPRAMLITSRFTTVLQYSTKDIAEGLMEEGWETEIIIESERFEGTSNRAILATLLKFEPDVVIQIDHLRYELEKFYPKELPFVCWIQDDLPNLTTRKAGDTIGLRDFVLTGASPVYVNKYKYPERQIIHLEKLTRGSSQEFHHCGEGPPDLVFVSNASQVPREAIQRVAEEFSEVDGLGEIIEASGLKMMSVYESGDSIISVIKIRSIIEVETKSRGGQWKSEEHLDKLAIRMSGILNNALYRQQALDWVVGVADDLGLSLELYGQGWEDNPKYARFARGYIQYGQPLEELTRRAKINLQILPYSCMHQRLLDGLSAGGFFLIRGNPLDLLARKIGIYIREAVQYGAKSIEDAFEKLESNTANGFRQCLKERAATIELYGSDCIRRYRGLSEEDQNLFCKYPPHYDEVIFHDALSLRDRLEHFLSHPECRSQVQAEMRNWVNQHYTYRSAWKRIMNQIGRLIATESATAHEDAV